MTARSGEEGSRPDRELERYSRQMLCAQIGEAGQRSLRRASVTLLGCGALGGVLANTLVRAAAADCCWSVPAAGKGTSAPSAASS